MYKILHESKVRVPRCFATFDEEDWRAECGKEKLETLSYPVLVKPDVGAGSVGVRIVHSVDEGLDAVEAIVKSPGFFGGKNPKAIVQEFVQGREYVVDTFSHNGVHQVKAICTYDKHESSSGALVYDRLRWLDVNSPLGVELRRYVESCLDGLRHLEGSVHAEVILDSNGPCLIDLGARPHGAGHPLKTYYLTGDSQLHSEVATVAETKVVADDKPSRIEASIEFLSLDKPGQIRSGCDPNKLLQLPGVISGEIRAVPGATYPETKSLLDSLNLGLIFISSVHIEKTSQEVRAYFRSLVEGDED